MIFDNPCRNCGEHRETVMVLGRILCIDCLRDVYIHEYMNNRRPNHNEAKIKALRYELVTVLKSIKNNVDESIKMCEVNDDKSI